MKQFNNQNQQAMEVTKSRMFQYVVLLHPTEKEVKDNAAKSTILTDVTSILAKDEKSAAMQATMGIDPKYKDQLDQVEVVVRPF